MITRGSLRTALSFVAVTIVAVCVSSPGRAQSGVEGAAPVFRGKPSQTNLPPSAEAQSVPQAPTIRVQSILVTTPVTVIDRSGEFVSDLEPKDFKIYDNGIQQQVERFEMASDPIALVILVQTDSSMDSLLYQVRGLAPMFSDLVLGPHGNAAVMGFSDNASLLQDFSNDYDQLKATFVRLKSSGQKARLNDALMQAMRLLEDRPDSERRVIVVFSDGSDHGSENEKADVVHRATSDGTTIYGLRLSRAEAVLKAPVEDQPMNPLDANVARPTPPGTVPTATNSAKVWDPAAGVSGPDLSLGDITSEFLGNALEYYARFTGGTYYSHWSRNRLQDQIDRIASEIHSQYAIAYKPTTLAQDGFHRIRVQVEDPNLRVRARAGYFYQPH